MVTKKQKRPISLENKTILITGCPGFIGAALAERLIKTAKACQIIALDNMNDYYDVRLKEYRLEKLKILADKTPGIDFEFIKGDVADKELVNQVFTEYRPSIVVNLAAQAGVRYSIDNPDAYINSNIVGFYNILEACRHSYDNGNPGVEHLVYASSSSVYGENSKVPFSTEDKVDNPVSLYAATKKSNELFAYTYSKLYKIPTTGLRFFTVYGPAGRPDMFYFTATEKLRKGEKIKLFNNGNMVRDFTYIDDIVEGVSFVMQGAPTGYKNTDTPYAIYNIGGGNPEKLLVFVDTLIRSLMNAGVLDDEFGTNTQKYIELAPMQKGDVPLTYADTKALEEDFGFVPQVGIKDGLMGFAKWYAEYYAVGQNSEEEGSTP